MSDRKYPDIDFVETDTETIESNLIALYENMVQQVPGRERYKVYPASPERLFIAWVANIIVQQRVIINETAKKNVPRYADGEYLDSLAELFKDLERLPASPASAMFRFYISEAQKQSVIIPAGTRISFDGAILFETKENLEIKAGQTYGDVEGICTTAGDVGNNLAAGQVKELVDLYDYYQKAENITATSGGAEEEDDASYYERMRESMESFSTAGPINGYIYWTKSVSPAVADVAFATVIDQKRVIVAARVRRAVGKRTVGYQHRRRIFINKILYYLFRPVHSAPPAVFSKYSRSAVNSPHKDAPKACASGVILFGFCRLRLFFLLGLSLLRKNKFAVFSFADILFAGCYFSLEHLLRELILDLLLDNTLERSRSVDRVKARIRRFLNSRFVKN